MEQKSRIIKSCPTHHSSRGVGFRFAPAHAAAEFVVESVEKVNLPIVMSHFIELIEGGLEYLIRGPLNFISFYSI